MSVLSQSVSKHMETNTHQDNKRCLLETSDNSLTLETGITVVGRLAQRLLGSIYTPFLHLNWYHPGSCGDERGTAVFSPGDGYVGSQSSRRGVSPPVTSGRPSKPELPTAGGNQLYKMSLEANAGRPAQMPSLAQSVFHHAQPSAKGLSRAGHTSPRAGTSGWMRLASGS